MPLERHYFLHAVYKLSTYIPLKLAIPSFPMENTIDKTDLKYCLYARKSSESDERQAISIDSQIKEMSDLARKEGVKIVKVVQESYSAKQYS